MALKRVVCLLLLAGSTVAPAQTKTQTDGVVVVPHATLEEVGAAQNGFQDIAPKGIFLTPPTMTLIPHSPQAHPGSIWLRSSDDGLHIWGRVEADEDSFRLPQQKSEMLSSDHIELWLAASPEVPMPTIGWGHQFGTEKLDSLKDCAADIRGNGAAGMKKCERWYGEQVQYRQYLQRLFVRQWLIGGGAWTAQPTHFFEDFASTAYAGLKSNFFRENLPVALEPKGMDDLTTEVSYDIRQEQRTNAAGVAGPYNRRIGYRFHIFVPYSSFPPAQQLKLTDLYLMVDVFGSAPEGRKMGEYSSTSAARQWGKPATFNHLRLATPRSFSITPCEEKPEQTDLYGEKYASWFFPTKPGKDATLQSTFALMNPAAGYMYEPGGVSPEAVQAKYFWKQLANGAAICRPNLAWHKGNATARSEFFVDEKSFEARALPDGWTLVRSGPTTWTHSPFGSGQCGACPVMGFSMYAVSPQGEISSALNITEDLAGQGDAASDADLAIDPDWRRITEYAMFRDNTVNDPQPNWTSKTYCLKGHTYEQCGESKSTQPPKPRNFPDLDQVD